MRPALERSAFAEAHRSRPRIDIAEADRTDTRFMTLRSGHRDTRCAHARSGRNAAIRVRVLLPMCELVLKRRADIRIRSISHVLRTILLRFHELLANFSAGQSLRESARGNEDGG